MVDRGGFSKTSLNTQDKMDLTINYDHTKETNAKAKCDACGGHGQVEKTIYRGDEGMEIEMDVMVECAECEGSGSLELEMDVIDCPECYGSGKV
jgi:DnaJ-class molecular chaperone